MWLLYELSCGKVDLSNVYARLESRLGILSENVSQGTGLFTETTPINHLDLELLRRAFDSFDMELERATFWAQTGYAVRKPIMDLDHVSVRPEFFDKVNDWGFDYDDDPRFQIREFPAVIGR